jgi:hypothetical protein
VLLPGAEIYGEIDERNGSRRRGEAPAPTQAGRTLNSGFNFFNADLAFGQELLCLRFQDVI